MRKKLIYFADCGIIISGMTAQERLVTVKTIL